VLVAAVARRFPRLPSDQDDLAVCVDLDPLHLNPRSDRRAQRARQVSLPKGTATAGPVTAYRASWRIPSDASAFITKDGLRAIWFGHGSWDRFLAARGALLVGIYGEAFDGYAEQPGDFLR
jgi:hypothetical protein